MNRINILNLLQHIEDYVLLKRSEEFPQYVPGSDIDLMVLDKNEVINSIYSFYKSYADEICELEISDTQDHCHIDFFFEGKLDIRIDLIEDFNFFERIAVKRCFFVKVFKDRQLRASSGGEVYVPCDEDDLTLRYFEYLEWFDLRSDKIKHIDYICTVEDEVLKQKFFANTHRFIQFKRKTWVLNTVQCSWSEPRSRKEALQIIRSSLYYLISTTLKKSVLTLRRKSISNSEIYKITDNNSSSKGQ